MTASPARNTGLPITLVLNLAGSKFDTDRIVSVETWSQANKVPRARITLLDGEADSGKFPLGEGNKFVPGTPISIEVGYESSSSVIHNGVIVSQAIRIVGGGPAHLVVESADPLLAMTLGRRSVVSNKVTDADLISTLVNAYQGTVGTNNAGTEQAESFVQAHATDWDLMLLRAEAGGCLVFVDDSKVDILDPTSGGSPVLELAYGDSIFAFDAAVDASDVLANDAVKSRAWSYADQKVAEQSASGVSVNVPGNLKSTALAEVLGVSSFVQQTAASRPESALTAWSSAALMRSKLSQLTGTVRFQGSALAKPGKFVTLANLGDRFNGDAFVSGVSHYVRDGDWQTTIELGMPAKSFASRDPGIVDPPAAGLAPPIRGLQIGQVKQVADDPNGDFRVLLTVPMIDGDNAIWARLAQPYASNTFGWSFFPEVGDEVVLGFMNEDPASAVIIASVYSNKRPPTHTPNKPNDVKALVTRSKMEINFNDKDIVFKVSTPGGRYVTLDDKEKSVTVADPFGNKLVMTQQSVDLISTANMNIKSTANMNIDCGANLTITAKAQCDTSAASISSTAQTQLEMTGTAKATFKSSALVEITGALVKIN
jgi:Rhs element Vgr protein